MMGRSGAPAVEPPTLPAGLEQAAAVMGILELISDPDRLAQAVKELRGAAAMYQERKAAADEALAEIDQKTSDADAAQQAQDALMRKRETELKAREDSFQAREETVKKREDAMAEREAKIRAALS